MVMSYITGFVVLESKSNYATFKCILQHRYTEILFDVSSTLICEGFTTLYTVMCRKAGSNSELLKCSIIRVMCIVKKTKRKLYFIYLHV